MWFKIYKKRNLCWWNKKCRIGICFWKIIKKTWLTIKYFHKKYSIKFWKRAFLQGHNIFKSVKTDEKREILNLIFSNFILDEKNVEISMRKTYNLLSETRGCIEWWWIEIEMAITDTLKQKVSVIKNTSRPYFTYISRYGASSPFVMNEGI